MNFSLPTNINDMHHAYLLEGETSDELFSFLEEEVKYPTHGNPDVWHGIFQKFLVDDMEAFRRIAYLKPVQEDVRVFVLQLTSISNDVQNALLKILEEPSVTSRLFIVAPRRDLFIPTVQSRLIYAGRLEGKEGKRPSATTFAKSTPAERLKQIEKLVKEKDHGQANVFLKELEEVYGKKKNTEAYQILWDAIRMLSDTSMPVKAVLENVALVLPQC